MLEKELLILKAIFPHINETLIGDKNKVKMHCIYHNDNRMSAVVFLDNGWYQCSGCDKSVPLVKLVQDHYKLSTEKQAKLFIKDFKSNSNINEWQVNIDNLFSNPDYIVYLASFGFSPQVLKELKIGHTLRQNELFSIPVFIDGELQDVRTYMPTTQTYHGIKWASQSGATSGLIVPFDVWKNSPVNEPTFVCAGEKDMLLARSKGLNAICITGGELTLPKYFGGYFQNRTCYVLYDNDEAGVKGGNKIANWLFNNNAKVKNVVGFHEVLENKGDIYDFFKYHNKSVADLMEYVDSTPWWDSKDSSNFKLKKYPELSLTDLRADTDNLYTNKWFSTKTQCVESNEAQYSLVTKAKLTNKQTGQITEWIADIKTNPKLVYNLFSNTKYSDSFTVHKMSNLDGKPNEYTISDIERTTFYTAKVRQHFNQNDDNSYNDNAVEYFAFSSIPLKSSKTYDIVYNPITDITSKNQIILVISDAIDTLNLLNFNVDDSIKKSLDKFKPNLLIESAFDKWIDLFNHASDEKFLGNKQDPAIWQFFELTYCSPLQFIWKSNVYRGALHSCIIGDSQIGKSHCLKSMKNIYGIGTTVNAKTATLQGLIGGSASSDNQKNNVIRAGVLPLNNRGLVGLEEIHGLKLTDYYAKVTEIKSSDRIIINRVSGTGEFECLLRLIEISNSTLRKVKLHANGYQAVEALIGRPEDIARNDLYCIVTDDRRYSNKVNSKAKKMLPKIDYENRMKWIWSRTKEQVKLKFNDQTLQEACDVLNNKYRLEAPIFIPGSTEIKVIRLACAFAGALCSTDETYQNIVVLDDHIKLAWAFFDTTYSSIDYGFDKASNEYKRTIQIDELDINNFTAMLKAKDSNYDALMALATAQQCFKSDIYEIFSNGSGAFEFINTLRKLRWITFSDQNRVINPTKKFRNLCERFNVQETNFTPRYIS